MTTRDNQRDVWRDNDVGQFFGVSRRSVIRWRKTGRLPYFKIGTRIFYKRASIEAMIDRKEVGGPL